MTTALAAVVDSRRSLPPWLVRTAGTAAAIVVLWGTLYTAAYVRMRAEVDALREMNRRMWIEIQLLQSELDMLDSDLRREGLEMRRAGSHDDGS